MAGSPCPHLFDFSNRVASLYSSTTSTSLLILSSIIMLLAKIIRQNYTVKIVGDFVTINL
jgi:hypothetical protein